MQLYFIRHAQSVNNAVYNEEIPGKRISPDPELTEKGWQQASLLADFLTIQPSGKTTGSRDLKNLNGFHLTHLYSSLMIRAVATASLVSNATGLPLHPWLEVYEAGGIFWEDEETGVVSGQPGMGRDFFVKNFPQLVLPENMYLEGWYTGGLEPQENKMLRARLFLQGLLEKHGGTADRVAVFSHGGFYSYFMLTLLGKESSNGYWFSINNTGISRIDFDGEHIEVIYTNRTDHLPDELITY